MQLDDLLAKHRRDPAPRSMAPTNTNPPQTEGYVAFAAKDSASFLVIRPVNEPWRSPVYNYHLDVWFDGPFGTNFTIHFTLYTVFVRGHNLQAVIAAVQNRMAVFIEEYDRDRFPKPTDEKAPFISSIRFQMNDDRSRSEPGREPSGSANAQMQLH